jgi:hypothetical protein
MFVPGWFGFERSWLARAMKAVNQRPDIFARASLEDAQRHLGLGNQQVFAVEHWVQALGLVVKTSAGYSLSASGAIVAEHDPQVEEMGTWYALHYWLATTRRGSLAYWCAANQMPPAFTRSALQECIARELPGKSLHTYTNHLRVFFAILHGTPIGNDMRLFTTDGETVRRRYIDTCSVPEAIAAYMLSDWAARNHRSTASIAEIELPEAPGALMFMASGAVNQALDRIVERYCGKVLWLSRTAGLNSIGFGNIPPLALLRSYYYENMMGVEPMKALEDSIRQQAAWTEVIS